MKKVFDWFEKTPVTKLISSLLIMVMACIMFMNVITRYVFGFSFNWGDEILRYMAVYLAFVGVAAAWETPGTHVAVTLFCENLFPKALRPFARILQDVVTVVFLAVVANYGFVLVGKLQKTGQISAALKLPMWLLFGIVPVSCILSILHHLNQVIRHGTWKEKRE